MYADTALADLHVDALRSAHRHHRFRVLAPALRRRLGSTAASCCALSGPDARCHTLPGEIIVREGEDCVSLFVLLEGEVRTPLHSVLAPPPPTASYALDMRCPVPSAPPRPDLVLFCLLECRNLRFWYKLHSAGAFFVCDFGEYGLKMSGTETRDAFVPGAPAHSMYAAIKNATIIIRLPTVAFQVPP
eukprot:337051-Rhodomonas_salina.2